MKNKNQDKIQRKIYFCHHGTMHKYKQKCDGVWERGKQREKRASTKINGHSFLAVAVNFTSENSLEILANDHRLNDFFPKKGVFDFFHPSS